MRREHDLGDTMHRCARRITILAAGLGLALTAAEADAEAQFPGELDAVVLPVGAPSIFTQPALTQQAFRGRPPHDGVDGRILDAIGRPDAHEVLIQPVAIRSRVVNLLYVDNGGDPLADTSVAALRTLGETMAAAYERLILEAKRSR